MNDPFEKVMTSGRFNVLYNALDSIRITLSQGNFNGVLRRDVNSKDFFFFQKQNTKVDEDGYIHRFTRFPEPTGFRRFGM